MFVKGAEGIVAANLASAPTLGRSWWRRSAAQEVQTSKAAALSAYGPDAHLKLGLSLDAELVGAIRHFRHFLLEWGFLEHDIDVEAWVDRRLMMSGAAAA